jgi:hypothetical protein
VRHYRLAMREPRRDDPSETFGSYVLFECLGRGGMATVHRAKQRFDGASSAQTPVLTVAARPDNNEVGNRAAVPLAGVADAARPTELRGDAIYRYATVGSDLRNLAVAR